MLAPTHIGLCIICIYICYHYYFFLYSRKKSQINNICRWCIFIPVIPDFLFLIQSLIIRNYEHFQTTFPLLLLDPTLNPSHWCQFLYCFYWNHWEFSPAENSMQFHICEIIPWQQMKALLTGPWLDKDQTVWVKSWHVWN